jgi:hypothetical protein
VVAFVVVAVDWDDVAVADYCIDSVAVVDADCIDTAPIWMADNYPVPVVMKVAVVVALAVEVAVVVVALAVEVVIA